MQVGCEAELRINSKCYFYEAVSIGVYNANKYQSRGLKSYVISMFGGGGGGGAVVYTY